MKNRTRAVVLSSMAVLMFSLGAQAEAHGNKGKSDNKGSSNYSQFNSKSNNKYGNDNDKYDSRYGNGKSDWGRDWRDDRHGHDYDRDDDSPWWGNHWDNDWDHDQHHDWDRDWDDDWKDFWNKHWKKDWDKGQGHGSHNGKVYICHRTSSAKNPYVLIKVSTSATQAHYDHGDPVEFNYLNNGKCSPQTLPPPPPPPPPVVEICAISEVDFIGVVWTGLVYDKDTGRIEGAAPDMVLEASVTPAGGLFDELVNPQLDVDVMGIESLAAMSTAASVFGEEPERTAKYTLQLFNNSDGSPRSGSAQITFYEGCSLPQ